MNDGLPKTSNIRRGLLLNDMRPDGYLPYDAELEYLQTDGGQYIYLGLVPDITSDACEMYFQQSTNVTALRIFYGNKLDVYINSSNNFAVNLYGGSDTWQQAYNVNVGTVKRKWKVDYSAKKVYVDDYNVYTYTKTLVNTATSDVAAIGVPSNSARRLIGKVFHIKYWKNGELVRDMIPVKKNNVGMLYDKVGGRLYENAGTGSFVCGRERYTKLSDYTQPDYVISCGSKLDTRFIANGNTRATLDMWARIHLYNGTFYTLFGARTAYKTNDFTFNLTSYDATSTNMYPRDVYGNNAVWPGQFNMFMKRSIVDKNKGNTSIIYPYENNLVGYSTTRTAQTFNSRYPTYLGSYNNAGATSYAGGNFKGVIFSFKLYDNDVLTRDYIPVIHPDGTCGLFDNVEKHFYPSDVETRPYRPGYIKTSSSGHKYVYFNSGVDSSLAYTNNNSDLLSSLIPVTTRRIKVKSDSNYTTSIVEYGVRRIIKKGGHTVISSDANGDVIEVSPECSHIAILIEGATLNYIPNADVSDVGVPNYLAFTALESGTFTLSIGKTITVAQIEYIEYSVDEGITWTKTNNVDNTAVTITTPTITAGNRVLWRGIGERTANNTTNNTTYSKFSSTGQCDVSGNIMSILRGEDFAKNPETPTEDGFTFGALFYQMTTLIHAHELCLPTFVMRTYGYWSMFGGCTSLVTIPKLNTEKLNTHCYQSLFTGCSSITSTTYLPARYLEQYCYYYTFRNCTSLTTTGNIIPSLLDLNSTYTFDHMFAGCTSLQDASDMTINLLDQNYTCQYMFSGCTVLTSPPVITATSVSPYACQYMFENCTSLVTAPSLSTITSLSGYCYQYMFTGCTALVNAPALPATTLSNYCYQHMFRGCTSLTTAPALPATTITNYAYSNMFFGCISLVNPPTLPATVVNTYGYNGMFHGCTSLATAPELPAFILGTYCYLHMFTNTAITVAPALIAPIVPANAYIHMFSGCNSLNYIKCTAADISATSCISGWTGEYTTTYDDTQSGVASTGIFIQRASVTWDTGVSGIPSGWTVIYLNPEDGKYYTDSACTTLWSNSPALPYTSKIEYLQNDGTTARIRTKLNRTNIDAFEIKFYYTTWVSGAPIVSNYGEDANNIIGVVLNTSNNGNVRVIWDKRYSNAYTLAAAASGEAHVLIADATSVTIDLTETALTGTTSGTANTNQIALFARNGTNSTVYNAGIRIYYFKAWYNGTLMRSLIPVRVGDVGAMYDMASGELLTNPYDTAFTLGQDIT